MANATASATIHVEGIETAIEKATESTGQKQVEVFDAVKRFRKIECENAQKAGQYEKAVGIDPNTYIAKEILYQTAELKLIREDLAEIKRMIKKRI